MNARDKKYLLISICLHVGIMLALTLKVYFFSADRAPVVRAVRVDLVALPDKDPEEGPQGVEKPPVAEAKKPEPPKKKDEPVKLPPEKPSKVTKKKEPKEEPKKETPKEDSKATKEQQNDAVKRLKALADLRKKMKDVKGPEGKQYKGNQLNEGTSLTGVEKIQYDKYLALVTDHIKRNWQLPEWLAQKNLSGTILVRFDESGNILEKRVIQTSGNPAFDSEAMQAVVASAPLPLPPENTVNDFKVNGLKVRFP